MTIKPAVRVSDGKLIVKDRTILTGVPDNVVETSASSSGPVEGVFVGAAFDKDDSHHVVSLGTLRDVRFLACFRFKLWWMAQKMGDKGRDIPLETQFLLVETKDGSHLESDDGNEDNQIVYTVFLPLIEGSFRACLQGNADDQLELCLESGDSDTKTSSFTHSLFISAGTDPFGTIHDAFKAVKNHLNTFRLRNEKKLPGIVDYFGWCTWDAFYHEVTQEGVESGLATLAAGGTPPKFVIIDDGWQSVGGDPQDENSSLKRLTGIKENPKFQNKEDPTLGIKNIVNIAKQKHGLQYVYVWHAITGYWGGVRPGVKEMEEYGSEMRYPKLSKGVVENEPTWTTDALAVKGLGLVNPKKVYKFYDELHSYLAHAGVDGVKVDVQCILETLGGGLGGRVELTRQYHQALDASIARNFPDNGCIACMSHNTDALYCSKQTAVVRASDDFYPRDPVSHTIHIAAVAYNSVFLGEIMQPDWDMFHSLHPAAEYHASARAISGGPIYVSDAPGKHDFQLLRKLVLPDGSVLRARLPGRPTKDCLFRDPTRDGVSLLKIWNMNKYTGVIGVYNCQGAAWSSLERKNAFHETTSEAITGYVRGRDVHHISEAAASVDGEWNGDCAVYCHRTGELVILPYNVAMPVSLRVLEHDVFTVTPVKVLGSGVSFAPVGLIEMYNAGGAIERLVYEAKGGRDEIRSDGLEALVRMEVKGCGKFGAYSSAKPRRCLVGSKVVDFDYNSDSGLMILNLDHMPEEGQKVHIVEVEL
ncbi:probable galactinol--sucrose galactosyltransferase 6 [Neltuma alba]|uniref:probable galactinol--sucrose galactosyltransferase 6 n=1 Tax=Neltuma alba TaxID=207710 RepID=UPI0010A439D2|nr:probable galactinol--sucrose galactosyltransferase 6 [Prosopis alba]XP_028790453.1 probable galactinol--sucrose galactosyltransferase 6 [Prosopis alba]XP_028790454.1 probable galactinol--sucrose galactosyltransferase 6 [Prosopis alba]